MDIVLLLISLGLPIAKIVLFPARTMGRGGGWTIVGAAMLVCLMMAIWFAVQSASDTATNVANATAASTTAGPASGDQLDGDAVNKLIGELGL